MFVLLQQSGTWKRNNHTPVFTEMNGTYSPATNNSLTLDMLNGSIDSSLAHSPATPSPDARNRLLRPKSLVERARMNVG